MDDKKNGHFHFTCLLQHVSRISANCQPSFSVPVHIYDVYAIIKHFAFHNARYSFGLCACELARRQASEEIKKSDGQQLLCKLWLTLFASRSRRHAQREQETLRKPSIIAYTLGFAFKFHLGAAFALLSIAAVGAKKLTLPGERNAANVDQCCQASRDDD